MKCKRESHIEKSKNLKTGNKKTLQKIIKYDYEMICFTNAK